MIIIVNLNGLTKEQWESENKKTPIEIIDDVGQPLYFYVE